MQKNFTTMAKDLIKKFVSDAELTAKARLRKPTQQEQIDAEDFLKSISNEKTAELGAGRRIAQYTTSDGGKLLCLNWDFTSPMAKDAATIAGEPIEILEIEDFHFLTFHIPLELGLREDVAEDVLEDEVLGPLRLGEQIALGTLRNLSGPFTLLRVNKNSRLDIESAERVGHFLWTFSEASARNNVSERTLHTARELLLTDHRNFPVNNIPTALSLQEPKYVFLEFYRCLELVYSFPRVSQLWKRIEPFIDSSKKTAIPLGDFTRWCSDDLGWRRTERDSVIRLMQEVAAADPQAVLDLCVNVRTFHKFNPISENWTVDESEVREFAETLYDVRNQVAHQFWPDQEKDLTSTEYLSLTEFITACLRILYSHYQHA